MPWNVWHDWKLLPVYGPDHPAAPPPLRWDHEVENRAPQPPYPDTRRLSDLEEDEREVVDLPLYTERRARAHERRLRRREAREAREALGVPPGVCRTPPTPDVFCSGDERRAAKRAEMEKRRTQRRKRTSHAGGPGPEEPLEETVEQSVEQPSPGHREERSTMSVVESSSQSGSQNE